MVGESAPAGTARPHARWRDRLWWQVAVAVVAVAGGVAAVWVTLPAAFLRYSAWLAAQKADFVIGPALTGLYWVRRRPQSPFGLMLIAWGFVGVLYILQSSSDSWLFTIGLFWEKVFGLGTYVLILAFPTGRLDRPSKAVLIAGVVIVLVSSTAIQLLLPQLGAGGSISSCRSLCPRNELAVTSDPGLARDLFKGFSAAVLVLAAATATLVIRRFVTGTPPRRRALAVGTPVALLFLMCEISFQLLTILDAQNTGIYGIVIWVFVAARAAVWYGFLFALIAAEVFAARAMQRLLEQSLHHPSEHELELMLREPLGDPRLRLEFLNRDTGADAEREAVEAGPGRDVTVVQRDGIPAVAMEHDAQLDDDPELLNAAGAVALLAAENAQLDAGWQSALQALRESRARLVRAGDAERRKVEQNLHDGVQQRLIALRIELTLAAESTPTDPEMRNRLHGIGTGIEEALDELREVAHGLYPAALADLGLVSALRRIRVPSGAALTIDADAIARHPPELEAAVYYSCLEGIQNASKHAGPAVAITVALREQAGELTFQVSDDGPGFEPATARPGAGLQNMRDRIGALDGRLSIVSEPGGGTTVAGSVPLRAAASGDPAVE
jgi:signal transduction histidine kinase